MTDPIISTDVLTTETKELAPGARLVITNIPMIRRTGGGRDDVREYLTLDAAYQVIYLRQLARIRMAHGETDIRLDFGDDASVGRRAFEARARSIRERYRKSYVRRISGVRRSGSASARPFAQPGPPRRGRSISTACGLSRRRSVESR
jgi:hypothetical protein